MSAIRTIEGRFYGDRGRYCTWLLGASTALVVESLLSGAIDALKRHGVKDKDIPSSARPGAFEIPLVVQGKSPR